MDHSISNAFLHKHILRLALPLMLHDRLVVHGAWNDGPVVCVSFDCETRNDLERVPCLLDLLKEHNITTTFAMFADLIDEQIEVAKEVLKKGHEIMNHSKSHPSGFGTSSLTEMRTEVEACQEFMMRSLSYRPRGFRAPHLMRKYDGGLFRILSENQLYDSSYVGRGVSVIDGTTEIPLASCPDHPQLCFDFWHHFELPYIRSDLGKFLNLWEDLLRRQTLVNVFLDPHLAQDDLLQEMFRLIPDSYRFSQLKEIADVTQTPSHLVKG